MKNFTLFVAMLAALFVTSVGTAQDGGGPDEPISELTVADLIQQYSDQEPEFLYPDTYEGDVYVQQNTLARAAVCIERLDPYGLPTLVFDDYTDYLQSSQAEAAEYANSFPNGVRAVYRTADGGECTYTHFPETMTEVTVNEAMELLFEMPDFWGAVKFLIAPSTTITIDDPEDRRFIGYNYIIVCGKEIYVGETKVPSTRFNTRHPMYDCMDDEGTCIFITPIYVDGTKGCPEGKDFEGKDLKTCYKNVRRCREKRIFDFFNGLIGTTGIPLIDCFDVIRNTDEVIISDKKCKIYEGHFNPTNKVFRKKCFEKKVKNFKLVPCDPSDKTEVPDFDDSDLE